ncbi:hypothetical protein HK096_009787, partial [Nowakowskiella sp. JEL0078]
MTFSISHVVSAALVSAAVVYSLDRWLLSRRHLHDKNPVVKSGSTHVKNEAIIKEQLARNYAFLGDDGVQKVRNSFVIVVGLGGVGSHAAHMLLRSGVEISIERLNRHAVATQSDVGTPKPDCLAAHLLQIAPHATIEPIISLFSQANASKLLANSPDYVVDCIDNMETKIDLLAYCHAHNIRVVSAMGAGAKSDPSRIQIADISDTFEDPLARATRRGLRARGIENGITVVYSTEKPGEVKLLPLAEEKAEEAGEFAVLPNFRVRILPVLGTIPALFGCAIASYVITELAQFKVKPLAVQARDAMYMRIHRDLSQRELNVFKSRVHIPLNIRDIGYIVEEIWFGKSALSGTFDKCVLTRWDITKPADFGNLICLSKSEAQIHDKLKPDELASYYSVDFLSYVD